MKGLSKMNREDIINFIAGHKAEFEHKFGAKKIGIFGSYARGEVREGSDIDIVVELEKPDLFCLIGIKQMVEEAFDCKVDVVRLRDNMNEALRRRIERDAIYV
jgi:predicted nucleotidyltransferase